MDAPPAGPDAPWFTYTEASIASIKELLNDDYPANIQLLSTIGMLSAMHEEIRQQVDRYNSEFQTQKKLSRKRPNPEPGKKNPKKQQPTTR